MGKKTVMRSSELRQKEAQQPALPRQTTSESSQKPDITQDIHTSVCAFFNSTRCAATNVNRLLEVEVVAPQIVNQDVEHYTDEGHHLKQRPRLMSGPSFHILSNTPCCLEDGGKVRQRITLAL